MKPFTERLLQVALIVAVLYFGWGLAKDTLIAIINAERRAAIAEQQLMELRRPQAPPAAGR